jgi:hypothetical protein
MTQESAWQSNLSAEPVSGGVGYTEQDMRIVLDALRLVPTGRWHGSEIARGVLAALAAAGRLRQSCELDCEGCKALDAEALAAYDLGIEEGKRLREEELRPAGRLLPEDTRTEREAKNAVLADFHDLHPRIPGLAVDGCHCNLLVEVAFAALRRVGPWVPVPEAGPSDPGRWTAEELAEIRKRAKQRAEQIRPLVDDSDRPLTGADFPHLSAGVPVPTEPALVCGCGNAPDGAPGAAGCSPSCMLPEPDFDAGFGEGDSRTPAPNATPSSGDEGVTTAHPAPLCPDCAGAGWPDGIHACSACGGSGEEKPQ